ncbi:M36 family metallopeptidase [Aeromicrobium sp.]|uniref:M36 family metallopeptidase n=1 Tax=Aeromicrobium sp. TaxID=1871063 RepID=UPI003D6A24DF
MHVHLGNTRRRGLSLLGTAALGLLMVATMLPADGQAPSEPDLDGTAFSFQGEEGDGPTIVDARQGSLAPTAAQKAAAEALGATATRWNQFGTPHVLMNQDGYLSAPRAGDAADVARGFVLDHRELFRMSGDSVAALEVVTDSPLLDSPDLARSRDGKPDRNADVAHVVTFRQTFGDLDAAHDGLLTVGVQRNGRVAWVSSSVTGDEKVSGTRSLDAAEAIDAAAANAKLDLGTLSSVDAAGPWTTFTSSVSRDPQRARLMAMPTPTDGVRLVWESTLLKGDHTDKKGQAEPAAFISFVDAETGKVLLRDKRVDHAVDGLNLAATASAPAAPAAAQFSGKTDDADACTPKDARHGPFAVEEGNGQITVNAAVTMPNGIDDDITINLYEGGKDNPVASQDLLGSPEVLTYSPDGGVPAGDYFVEVCEFNSGAGSIGYAGSFSAGPGSNGGVELPRWRVFPSNPNFTDSAAPNADTRQLWCWVSNSEACEEEQINDAARLPWDVLPPSLPSFTTAGNNASTAISEVSFLTPDTQFQRPFSPDRRYNYPWQNTWFNSSCDPSKFDQPGGNDDDASTANLFVSHNRMHDWSYFLGFTELNSNMQVSNFGNTGPTRENDPEVGNAQAGRRTFNGRDNANQITLQDGIAPITNQYLWQPLAGAFYAACTDGAYDMAVVAHEYGHAISNRMVAGPDTGTGNTQGQTESWSDLIFSEYFRGYGINAGEGANPFALAPYVSGNKDRGIRNYGMNNSPLNYSDLEYDGTGTTSPHADSEIWSAVNFDIAKALNDKYDAQSSSSSKTLQRQCAKGEQPADECPGNRRWAQIMFDGLLLTPSGSTMLDSRDAMLAADRLRFDGANQAELWDSFARRGMGETASSPNAEDKDPVPGWSTPLADNEATVRFKSADTGGGEAEDMTVFTGDYEARISPTADTDAETETSDTVDFVPGTYQFIAQAPGHGATRFTRTFESGQDVVVSVPMQRNLASADNGATATGDGINLESLIDDTEETNWASLESAGTASEGKGEGKQVQGRQVTVKLSTTPEDVSKVKLSAALRPTDGENEDSGSQSRFSALRSFEILACDATVGDNTCADDEAEFDIIYRSSADAFPGVRPRPAAADLTLRGFDVTDVQATHIRIRVRDNQCTGGPLYQAETNPSNDPVFSNPDCDSEEQTPDRAVLNPPYEQVRIAELQVFGPS